MLRCALRATHQLRLPARQLAPLSTTAASRSDDDVFVDEVDVLVVGGGPAGLSAAIRAKQAFAAAGEEERRVCVLEKGAEVGAHILSGNVFETRALDELIPEWKEKGAPVTTAAKDDVFVWLTSETSSITSPITPPQMHNDGNYIISLSNLCKWMGDEAEALGALFAGNNNRAVAEHSLNANSSRSHCVFTVHVTSRSRIESESASLVGKLHCVDLAGSERNDRSKSQGERLKEAQFINGSLAALGDVVECRAWLGMGGQLLFFFFFLSVCLFVCSFDRFSSNFSCCCQCA